MPKNMIFFCNGKVKLRRFFEEVAARESTRAQPECVTDHTFAVEAKQPSNKRCAQSPPGNQQQPVLRANTTSHRVRCIGLRKPPVTTRKNSLQLLHGGLEPVQEHGALDKLVDELRLLAPSLGSRSCKELIVFAPSLDNRACVHD
jgi:hypothetical protein